MDLNLLVVFDTLMAERNVTRAAARNGLSQPAVSKALSRLRYLFDDPLFVLRDRAMEPTARARELAGPIRSALADISKTLMLPAEFDPATIRATLRIATNDLYHTSLLPSLIQHLRAHAPGVDLQVRAMTARACWSSSPPARSISPSRRLEPRAARFPRSRCGTTDWSRWSA